jgi:chemosensory pili system protein ChpA (sensor histidine kinase/response regulator)
MALNVLVVDDDAHVRETIGIHLRNAGYEVRTSKNGIEGGYAVLRKRPDLIIMDVQMPYMDGFELLAALRADQETRNIPVMMLTTENDCHERAKTLGANCYVTKPIFADKLLELVAAHVARAASRGRPLPPMATRHALPAPA